MNLVEFTKYLVLNVVSDKDAATIKEFPSDEENTILIQVLVNNDDMPKLIGKNGRVISSIRTLVQASSYIKDNKQVKIEVDSF